MPSTWAYWSTHVFSYIEDQTPFNEEYVALNKIQYHLNQGYDEEDIALIWNQGNPSPCKSGTNKHGVKFDSCAYKNQVLAYLP